MARILGGPNSRQEVKILAPNRIRPAATTPRPRGVAQHSLSEGEIVALSWACEMSALAEDIAIAGERILQIDFDQFLHEHSCSSFASCADSVGIIGKV